MTDDTIVKVNKSKPKTLTERVEKLEIQIKDHERRIRELENRVKS